MPDEWDALDRIAQSYATLATTHQTLARTQQVLARLQGFAIVLIGFSLLFTGYLVWQHVAQGQEHAALIQALTVQTHALVEQMQQTPAH